MQSVHGNGHWSGQVRSGSLAQGGEHCRQNSIAVGCPLSFRRDCSSSKQLFARNNAGTTRGKDGSWMETQGRIEQSHREGPATATPFVAGLTRRSAPHVRCPDDDASEEKEQATPTPAARAPVHRLADGGVVGFWQWRGRQRRVGGVRLSGRTPWRADWRRARPCRAGIGSWLFLCSARSCETISL